jgi:signal transduction histidine kinase
MARRFAGSSSLLTALFGRMVLLFLLIIAIVGGLAFFTARAQIDETYDGQLIISANVLRALMAEEVKEAQGPGQLEIDDSALQSPEDREAFDSYAQWRMFRIWRGRQMILGSDTGPKIAAPPGSEGFSEVDDHARWRIYTLKSKPDFTVQVGERTDIRLALVGEVALGLALPLLLLIPLAAALMWFTLRGGLHALRTLISEIGRRTMRDLSPLPLDPWPRDLHPLVRSINRLFGRIDRALEQERAFLDNAAHQIRTPLAAVKLQAQMAASETDSKERAALSRQLVDSVDRAASMAEDLLTLARLEAQVGTGEGGDLRVETVAAMTDLAPMAARRDVELAFEAPERLPAGDPILLRLIAANLIENALNHAPAGSEVQVRLAQRGEAASLEVIDAGPGIPLEERRRVLQRFYRGASGVSSGSGLGLSIVSEAVRLLGGKLELRDREDGSEGLYALVSIPIPGTMRG